MNKRNVFGGLILIVGFLLVGSFVVGVECPEWIRVVDLNEGDGGLLRVWDGVLERVKEVIGK